MLILVIILINWHSAGEIAMRARESAESGNGIQLRQARKSRPAKGPAPGSGGPGPASTAADRLDYIADMARQLERLSAGIGCHTLAALLELARDEAILQREAARGASSART
jgi:hypothetical protein